MFSPLPRIKKKKIKRLQSQIQLVVELNKIIIIDAERKINK